MKPVLLYENGVFYERCSFYEDYNRIKQYKLDRIYLYKWINIDSGQEGIDHVYVYQYKDFLALLEWWNYRGKNIGWQYEEL